MTAGKSIQGWIGALVLVAQLLSTGCLTTDANKFDATGTEQLLESLENPLTKAGHQAALAESVGKRPLLTDRQMERVLLLMTSPITPRAKQWLVVAMNKEINRRNREDYGHEIAFEWLDLLPEVRHEITELQLIDAAMSHLNDLSDRFEWNLRLFQGSNYSVIRYEALNRLVDETIGDKEMEKELIDAVVKRLQVEYYASVANRSCEVLGGFRHRGSLKLLEDLANDRVGRVFETANTRTFTLRSGATLQGNSFSHDDVKMAAQNAADEIRLEYGIYE
jgi:hypothetical protein